MTIVLDAGALIVLERDERAMWVRLETTHQAGELPVTRGGVVGLVWRRGPREARLAAVLAGIDVEPVDENLGRRAGELLAATRTSDVTDGALVLLAADGDEIVALDRDDLRLLSAASGRHVEIVPELRPRSRRAVRPNQLAEPSRPAALGAPSPASGFPPEGICDDGVDGR